jgi:nucleotide-binding universal stress UspA family protein
VLKIKHILVPVDFSEHSRPAADHALNLANHFDARVTFLHAVEPVPYTFPIYETGFAGAMAMPPAQEVVESVSKALDSFVERLSANGRAAKSVQQGDVASVIEEQAQKQHADLIVMPTHGYGPFRRLVLGSVTTKVLNDVACPVFTGAHVESIPHHAPSPYRRIGVAVDLEHDPTRLLRWAADFAAVYHSKLLIIHGTPSVELLTLGAQIPREIRDQFIPQARESIAKILTGQGIEADIHVASTPEPDRLVAQAVESGNLDLLVIGRPHEDGILGRLSTHAYDIVRRSPCPVISV